MGRRVVQVLLVLFAAMTALPSVDSAAGTRRYQAEDASSWHMCAVKSHHPNYSGRGYIDCEDAGSWIEWNVPVEDDGMYSLEVFYSSVDPRPFDIIVDGEFSEASEINIATTSDWKTWSSESIVVELLAGTRTLRFLAVRNSMPNIDFIEITPVSFHLNGYRTSVVLDSGSSFERDKYIASPNNGYSIGFSSGGDLVFRKGSPVSWKAGVSGTKISMQGDGNLVVRNSSGRSLWSTKTNGNSGAKLVISNGGQAAVMLGPKPLFWLPPTMSPTSSPTFSPTESIIYIAGHRSILVLRSGSGMERGQFVESANGRFNFGINDDGDLVLRKRSEVIWRAGVTSGDCLYLQGDSNLVLRDAQDLSQWSSGTHGEDDGAELFLTDNGKAILLLDSVTPIFTLPQPLFISGYASAIVIPSAGRIYDGEGFFFSPNGRVSIGIRNGDLVLRDGSRDVWTAGVSGAEYLAMQPDGNVVLRRANGSSLWTTQTYGNRGARLALTDDGFMAVVHGNHIIFRAPSTPSPTPAPTWSTLRVNGYRANVVIGPGMRLGKSDGFISSPNGKFSIGLDNAGDLVLKEEDEVLWRAGIHGVAYLRQQLDGNIVARNSGGDGIWTTRTSGNENAEFVISDEGKVAVVSDSMPLLFLPVMDMSNFAVSSVKKEEPNIMGGFMYSLVLGPGANIERTKKVKSPNGRYSIGVNNDGDLVMKDRDSVLWRAGVSGGTKLHMQPDGNVVLRDKDDKVIWTSGTSRYPGAQLIIDSGGQAGVYLGSTPLWIIGKPRGSYTGPSSGDLQFPIRTIFYYPWFPNTWTVNGEWAKFEPSLGFYSSDDPAVIADHIDQLEYAHIELSVASWWGPESNSDRSRLTMLMEETLRTGSIMKWTVYYEDEFGMDPTVGTLKADLDYLKHWFAWHSTWAHKNGKPIIFVYNEGGCEIADRWMKASNGQWFVVLKVFEGYRDCANQPDSWHQYGPASAVIDLGGVSFSISPGFWLADRKDPRLPRVEKEDWRQNVKDMVASDRPWHIITTFNEAGEGTMIESSPHWESESGYGFYCDALHDIY